MEPEPEPVDLTALDPSRDEARWERAIASVAARGLERRRLRRAVVRRGAVAVVLAAAAGIAVWWAAPKPEPERRGDLLEWGVRDVDASEVLGLGGNDAR
jgi:hypothetical protein